MSNIQDERYFRTGHGETIPLKWEVKDFINFVKAGVLQKCNFDFDAGSSLGLSSRWRFQLSRENMLRLDLHLLKCSTTPVLAHFQWCIKQANNDANFWNVEAQMQRADQQGCEFNEGDAARSEFGSWSFDRIMPDLSKILSNGSLMIQIRFWLSPKKSFQSEEIGTRFKEGSLAVAENLQTLLASEENSDVILQLKDNRTLKAHKAILAARSPVFFAMFQSNMKEASSGVVTIEDLSYEAMSIILKFIYSGALEDKWVEFPEEIVNAAEQYSLTLLKEFCDQTLADACDAQNAMDLLKIARFYNLKMAEEKIYTFIAANVREVL